MSKTVKRNAIHSGIGDNDDLFVKRPKQEDTTEDFQYAARLRGKKRHDTLIYPEVNFQYDISYKGKTLETYNEKEYKFNINAHPEKKIDYCITETKELPVKRLWEAKGCFEAEVERMKLEYAFNYKGHTGIKDKRTAEYAVDWQAQYNVRNLGDVKDLFTDANGHFIGYADGSTGWRKNGSHVDDARNRSFFSGVVAKDMYKWNAYEASFTFKPILNDGAGIFGDTKRYNWGKKKFYNAGKWDDDIVGMIFQAQDKRNFYMMMWEADERIWMSGRTGSNLDGINITKNNGEFVDRQDVAPRNYPNPPTHAQWSNYVNNAGWGTKHYRIYKVTNGVMKRVNVSMKGSGKGWVMNNMHRVRIVTTGKNVKIYARTSPSASEFLMFNFNTDWNKGSFGMFNVSQSVEFHSIEVIERKVVEGRIPESGWNKETAASKTIATNATSYVKASDSFKSKVPSNIPSNQITMMNIDGVIRKSENGSISVKGLTKNIVVKSKDYTTYKERSGRIKPTGWLSYDGLEEYRLADNAQEYARNYLKLDDLVLDSITPVIKDSSKGKVTISSKTGPITIKTNSAPDAGKILSHCYIRCGIVEVTPDNRNYKTGLLVFTDIAKVFEEDYKEFFKRKDLINKKATYELTKPVKKEPPAPPPKEESEGGCVIEEPVQEEPPVIECLNDFDFDGKKLVMWSCEFPIETTRKCFTDKVVAFKGWTIFDPLASFSPNKWTTYLLEPIEASVNPEYDEIKWVGNKTYENAPVGSKVMIRTMEWYRAIFPADIVNQGIVTSELSLIAELPPAPEHFYHPTRTKERMPDTYEVIYFLLDAWDNHPDVQYAWQSNPDLTTDEAKRRKDNASKIKEIVVAATGQAGMPIIATTDINDKLIISCKEDPIYIPWASGKYIGYGKVNGKRPFFGEKKIAGVSVSKSGKADMVNVSTQVVFFPDNLVMETLQGPFINVYDNEFPNYPRVKYKLNEDKTAVTFSSDHTDSYIWYTDWYSNWVESNIIYSATLQKVKEIESPLNLDPTDPKVSADYNPDDTFIERIEVTSSNPFVKLWVEEDKGDKDGLIGTYYRFPVTADTYEESWNVEGDYQEWKQFYQIRGYMDKIEIPLEHEGATVLDVHLEDKLIPKSDNGGWRIYDNTVILDHSVIEAGNLSIRYSTGTVSNTFTLEKDLGSYIEVYVNGELIDSKLYSFDKREMTIDSSVLHLHDYVNIQSYDLNEMFDPTKREYLGEKVYSQLDFQEDIPTFEENPNYDDPYYEGSFCFNWGFRAPKKIEEASAEIKALQAPVRSKIADFQMMSMFKSEEIQFNYDIDMEIVYPVGSPIDISNFTGEWVQWDENPNKTGISSDGKTWSEGPGDWHGPPEQGFDRVTNRINQTPYSGWYNPDHVDIQDYQVALTARSETDWDNDMYGMTFRWNPVTMSGYTFEWDSGGAGVNGMAIYKLRCTNPEAIGTNTPLKFSKTQLAHDPEWWDPNATGGTTENRPLYEHRIKISAIGSKFEVHVDNRLKMTATDDTYKTGAWGPITRSNPNTYFWDFWMQTYKRVTPKEYPDFKKHFEKIIARPLIEGDNPLIDIELDKEEMVAKFQSVLNQYCADHNVDKADLMAVEYYVRNDKSDYQVFFKEFQEIRVLELTPDVLAPNPLGKTSIQQAVERFGKFDVSKTIKITQDKYSNWNKYKIEDYDVLTFTPADCNANFDLVSDEMMDWVRRFKNAANKVIIFTHDTGVNNSVSRFKTLLREFGFTLSSGVAYTRGSTVTRVDDTFNYPYDLAGDVEIRNTHWNQVNGSTPIYRLKHEPEHAYLSYINNVYYSEAGDSLYNCSGAFNQQLHDNEMKIWINLMCRIAQWEAGDKPKMTLYGQSKVYAEVEGQYPPVLPPSEQPVPYPPKPEIPELEPPIGFDETDGFTISWNGYIFAPASGVYRFKAMANDGFRLWIGGTEVINEWHITGEPEFFPEYDGSIYLEGGKWYSLRANYFDNVGQAMIRLRWAIPGKQFQRIDPKYLTPYLGYRLFAQVKQATPLPWHPLVHNGYYYHEEREHYLYAEKIVHIKTPDVFHEITISPRPQQGSAIIVRDNEGNNLRKVTFYDENWNLTLENTETLHGNGYAKYYMNYRGIDKETLKVKVNGKTLSNYDYIFHEEESAVEFMQNLHQTDSIEVKYKLLYSYYLDMNADADGILVNSDTAKIQLHHNYDASKMKNMQIIYEAAKETPFYRAVEATFNPILTHNHTGFLYITETPDQTVKDIKVILSEKTLSNSGKEKVSVTVQAVDSYNNPCPNKLVKIYRDDILIKESETNVDGEVYLYDTPTPTSSLISTYRVVCEKITKEKLLNYFVDNQAKRYYLDVIAEKMVIMAGVTDTATINMTLRDENWDAVDQGYLVYVKVRDTYGKETVQELKTNSYGQVQITLSGINEQHGSIFITASYDMKFEYTASELYLKVIGG